MRLAHQHQIRDAVPVLDEVLPANALIDCQRRWRAGGSFVILLSNDVTLVTDVDRITGRALLKQLLMTIWESTASPGQPPELAPHGIRDRLRGHSP
jgi:dihydroxyacid dehydratase/phosphogluconate dehydratase